MDADANSTQSSPGIENEDGATEGQDAAAFFPTMQEQKSFIVTRSIHEKGLVNTLNIRDYFFFSA
ncbi:hypothetical protein DSCO28_65140 [Desulfosarcina ovata subsp. sediminis]|uniref:Uncharacterized protein n=1 Tax=Desulfosarcina ovata subsp. sediminis TaxID=885957 RepID=A0A5K8A0I7_9BACT|nr:hypothetical protein [Desulfosarcina ovata]BBO85948.1 hypothetical protein DSCO28_65140 [Desulfosarcina ovata subsp. sediminis]